MSPKLIYITLLLFTLTLHAQELSVYGNVYIHNSKTDTGELKTIQNAQIFIPRGIPTSTDVNGYFKCFGEGYKLGSFTELIISKKGFVIVNENELKKVPIGFNKPFNIFLAKPEDLRKSRLEYFNIGNDKIQRSFSESLRELNHLFETEKNKYLAGSKEYNEVIEKYKVEFLSLENERKNALESIKLLSEKLSQINFDFSEKNLLKAVEQYKRGEFDECIKTLTSKEYRKLENKFREELNSTLLELNENEKKVLSLLEGYFIRLNVYQTQFNKDLIESESKEIYNLLIKNQQFLDTKVLYKEFVKLINSQKFNYFDWVDENIFNDISTLIRLKGGQNSSEFAGINRQKGVFQFKKMNIDDSKITLKNALNLYRNIKHKDTTLVKLNLSEFDFDFKRADNYFSAPIYQLGNKAILDLTSDKDEYFYCMYTLLTKTQISPLEKLDILENFKRYVDINSDTNFTTSEKLTLEILRLNIAKPYGITFNNNWEKIYNQLNLITNNNLDYYNILIELEKIIPRDINLIEDPYFKKLTENIKIQIPDIIEKLEFLNSEKKFKLYKLFYKIFVFTTDFDENILNVYKGNDNKIFISTSNKLFEYKDKKINEILFDNKSIPGITSLQETKQNELWFYSSSKYKLYRINNDSSISYDSKDASFIFEIISMATSNNTVWFATKYNLFRFENEKFIKYDLGDLSTGNQIKLLKEDTDGNLWFTKGEYDIYTIKNGKIDLKLKGDINVNDLYEDKDGVLWFATDNGILFYKKNKFFFQGTNGSKTITFNKKNNIREEIGNSFFTDSLKFLNNKIFSIGGLENNSVLFNTKEGVFKIENNSVKKITKSNTIKSDLGFQILDFNNLSYFFSNDDQKLYSLKSGLLSEENIFNSHKFRINEYYSLTTEEIINHFNETGIIDTTSFMSIFLDGIEIYSCDFIDKYPQFHELVIAIIENFKKYGYSEEDSIISYVTAAKISNFLMAQQCGYKFYGGLNGLEILNELIDVLIEPWESTKTFKRNYIDRNFIGIRLNNRAIKNNCEIIDVYEGSDFHLNGGKVGYVTKINGIELNNELEISYDEIYSELVGFFRNKKYNEVYSKFYEWLSKNNQSVNLFEENQSLNIEMNNLSKSIKFNKISASDSYAKWSLVGKEILDQMPIICYWYVQTLRHSDSKDKISDFYDKIINNGYSDYFHGVYIDEKEFNFLNILPTFWYLGIEASIENQSNDTYNLIKNDILNKYGFYNFENKLFFQNSYFWTLWTFNNNSDLYNDEFTNTLFLNFWEDLNEIIVKSNTESDIIEKEEYFLTLTLFSHLKVFDISKFDLIERYFSNNPRFYRNKSIYYMNIGDWNMAEIFLKKSYEMGYKDVSFYTSAQSLSQYHNKILNFFKEVE